MPTAGTVSINQTTGVATGSGLALAIYNGLLAEYTNSFVVGVASGSDPGYLAWPNPANPPTGTGPTGIANYTGSPAQWSASVIKAQIAFLTDLARRAQGIANGIIVGGVGGSDGPAEDVNFSGSPHVCTTSFPITRVDVSSGQVAITLPTGAADCYKHEVQNSAGDCSSNPITVSAPAGDTIESLSIPVTYGATSVMLVKSQTMFWRRNNATSTWKLV